jgi:hypothetical protein
MNISSRVYFELQGVNPDSMNNSLRSKYFFAGSSFGEGLKLLKVCSDDLKLVEIMPVSPSQRDIEKKMKVLDGVSRALIKGFLSGMEMFVPECFLQRYITLDVVNVSRYRQVIQAFMYNQKLQSDSNATLETFLKEMRGWLRYGFAHLSYFLMKETETPKAFLHAAAVMKSAEQFENDRKFALLVLDVDVMKHLVSAHEFATVGQFNQSGYEFGRAIWNLYEADVERSKGNVDESKPRDINSCVESNRFLQGINFIHFLYDFSIV